jgi:hypothetical protein
VSEFEAPERAKRGRALTTADVRELSAAATPHFALHVAGRIRRLTAALAADDPVRRLAETEIARLRQLAVEGERGDGDKPSERLLSELR